MLGGVCPKPWRNPEGVVPEYSFQPQRFDVAVEVCRKSNVEAQTQILKESAADGRDKTTAEATAKPTWTADSVKIREFIIITRPVKGRNLLTRR